MKSKYILIGLLCCLFLEGNANHLVGGGLTFQCRGNNNYQFFLSIYRDVPALSPGNDDTESTIFIYNLDQPFSNPTPYTLNQRSANGSSVPPNVINCTEVDPPNVQTNLKEYASVVINLPPNGNGYRVVYQRCCRNDLITNLAFINGFSQGSTYEVFLRPKLLEECSNATTLLPILEFGSQPPVRFCVNVPEVIDQSVDPSIFGVVDSVQYFLCTPQRGASATCPIVDGTTAAGCPPFPFDVGPVVYSPGFTPLFPLGFNSSITINRNTGVLRVIPGAIGLFVVNICVTAYKDGEPYTNVSRDLQYSVFDCGDSDAGVPEVSGGQDNVGGITNNDTSYVLYCGGLTVSFSQNSPDAQTFYWDFGVDGIDSDTSILVSPTYTYDTVGTYRITFIKDRGEPCEDTSYSILQLFPTFQAGFEFDAGCFTLPVGFTDTSISTLNGNPVVAWSWDFGDGSGVSTEQNPAYTYGADGTYQVELEVTSELGCVESTVQSVMTDPSPTASFENLGTCTGAEHFFNNTSNLNGTDLISYSWDFGDGNGFSLTTTSVNPPAQIYNTPGSYTIKLAVNSTSGCSDTVTNTLTVIESVEADFSFTPSLICPGQEIQFSNTTTQPFDSLIYTIDGNSFTIDNPIYSYNSPTSEAVSLVIYSGGICKDSVAKTVVIQNGPLAVFEGDSSCVNSNFQFQNNSIDNGFTIDSYVWNFGDGSATNLSFEPSHTYTTSGNYEVTLVVSSSLAACSDTTTDSMFIKGAIVPDFSFLPDTICEGGTVVDFSNLSSGGTYDSLVWSFGNGTISLENEPSLVYQDGGVYTVILSLFDDICGKLDTAQSLTVLDVPSVNLPDTLNICDGQTERLSVENLNNYLINWSTGATTHAIIIDNSEDTVTVVVNNLGCFNSDTVLIVRDCPAHLPNTFTPNGDGVNDIFLPLTYNITSFNLKVFDRWGDQVFETETFDIGWNGNYRDGNPAPIDNYTYIFEGVGLDEKPLFQTGNVTLLR